MSEHRNAVKCWKSGGGDGGQGGPEGKAHVPGGGGGVWPWPCHCPASCPQDLPPPHYFQSPWPQSLGLLPKGDLLGLSQPPGAPQRMRAPRNFGEEGVECHEPLGRGEEPKDWAQT